MQIDQSKQSLCLKAIILGFLTLASNQLLYAVVPGQLWPIGNIFLFLSAATLGPWGALLSLATGVLPEVLLTGELSYGLRLLIICSAIGYSAKNYPKIPPFIICIGLWLSIIGPLYAVLPATRNWRMFYTIEYFSLTALGEIFLVLMSGVLLFNQRLWQYLTLHDRHTSVQYVSTHLFSLIATIAIGAALLLPHTISSPEVFEAFYSNSGVAVFMLVALVVPLAAYFGWYLPDIIKFSTSHSLIINNKSVAVSANANELWRSSERNSESDEPHNFQGVSPLPATLSSIVTAWQENDVDGICAIDKNGVITFCNQTFCEISNFKRHDALCTRLEDADMLPVFKDELKRSFKNALSNGSAVSELKINKLPDKLRFFEVSAKNSANQDPDAALQQVDGVLITIRDITDRRTVESHLLQAQKVKSLGEVVGGLAHAFNNALTNIIGQASFAQHAKDEALKDRALSEIRSAAEKAGDLVWKLLEFADGGPDMMKEQDLRTLVEEHLIILEKMAGEKIEINYDSPEEALGALCDGRLIAQAITNLFINAKEALREQKQPEIKIELDSETIDDDMAQLLVGAKPGEYARLKLSDNGYGMSSETLSKAFKPLFTTKRDLGQAGVGLSIVYAIIRAHDGFLAIESKPEKGTSVSVYLPKVALKSDSLQSSKKAAKCDLEATPNNERILVVEDEPAVRLLVSKMLASLGYQVDQCPDGEEALERCAEDSFDLVLVDLMMPKMNGSELIQRLREQNQGARTLIMTGYSLQKCPPELQSGVIHKPFDMATLANSVRERLDK